MTDKQPEALRLAQELDAVPETGADPQTIQEAAAELRRLHAYCQELESHLILDCMTHVQNPAEIEHVAGDVSKNGAEVNTAGAVLTHKQAAAPTTQPMPQRGPTEIDPATMELAESVGLIGPASRTHDLHGAIQRFHDLICANATIKAAQMAAEAISAAEPQPSPAVQGDALEALRTLKSPTAQAAVAHMQRLFCGQEQEPHHG